jgi:homoprotocatechuate degradation regulator HpaR
MRSRRSPKPLGENKDWAQVMAQRKDQPGQAREPGHAHAPGSTMPRFSRSLPMLLLRAREAVMRHFRASLREHEVTEQQWRVLRALGEIGEVEVSDLARATHLLAPSLSRILPDLEARHLVVRRSDNRDLRRGLVALSDDGRALMETVTPHSEAIYARISERFGERKLAQLESLLRDLETGMSNGPESPRPTGRANRSSSRLPGVEKPRPR